MLPYLVHRYPALQPICICIRDVAFRCIRDVAFRPSRGLIVVCRVPVCSLFVSCLSRCVGRATCLRRNRIRIGSWGYTGMGRDPGQCSGWDGTRDDVLDGTKDGVLGRDQGRCSGAGPRTVFWGGIWDSVLGRDLEQDHGLDRSHIRTGPVALNNIETTSAGEYHARHETLTGSRDGAGRSGTVRSCPGAGRSPPCRWLLVRCRPGLRVHLSALEPGQGVHRPVQGCQVFGDDRAAPDWCWGGG